MDRRFLACAFLLLFMAGLAMSCTRSIPGAPQKTMAKYAEAIKKNDFDTIYRLNIRTARRKKFIEQSTGVDIKKGLKLDVDESKLRYEKAEMNLFSGSIWGEKFFFTSSSEIEVKSAYYQKPLKGDPVNSDYEKGRIVIMPVHVTYTEKNEAYELQGKAIKSIRYDCSLGKIREGKNVRIYSHDDRWYFSGCIPAEKTVQFFE